MGAPTGFPYESEAESDKVLESEKEEEAEKHLQDILEVQEHSVALKQKVRRSSGAAQKRLKSTELG